MMHQHTVACLARNELHELCCAEIADDRLQNCDRWVVLMRGNSEERLEAFTDNASDALALARADGKDPRMAESVPHSFPPDHPYYNERTQR